MGTRGRLGEAARAEKHALDPAGPMGVLRDRHARLERPLSGTHAITARTVEDHSSARCPGPALGRVSAGGGFGKMEGGTSAGKTAVGGGCVCTVGRPPADAAGGGSLGRALGDVVLFGPPSTGSGITTLWYIPEF